MDGQKKMISGRILIGKQAFCDALGVANTQLDTFVEMGLPVLKVNGKWCGHLDNIDEWFRAKTRVQTNVGQAVDGDGE